MKQAKEFFLRRIAAVLAILMVVVMFPVGTPAMATETLPLEETSELAAAAPKQEALQPQGVTADGLEYDVYSNHIEITHYSDSATVLVIPEEIEGLPVTRIGNGAFQYGNNLKSITIPSSVTTIGEQAFFCSSLTSITIPSGVTTIESGAFSRCSSLTSITIPSGITSIEDYVFFCCSSLTSITIPSGITSIGEAAFYGCRSLTSISIPSGITSIDSNAFSNCYSLTKIEVDANNATYCSENGILYSKQMTELLCCPGGKAGSISIPSVVTRIGAAAFYGCSGLESISIPNSVSTIESAAFVDCNNLKSITIPGNVTAIEDYTFSGCNCLASISVPSGITSIEALTFFDCYSLESISIPNSVTTIETRAFINCDSLSDVYYGGSKSGWEEMNIESEGNEDLLNATIHYAKVDAHDTINELTDVDYLAFSKIAYEDFAGYEGETLEAVLIDKGIWSKKFEKTDILYSELCKPIANWKVAEVCNFSDSSADHFTGFYAVAFTNSQDEAVIAYRGSEDFMNMFEDADALEDWHTHDIPSIVFNKVIDDRQYEDAMFMYESVSYRYSNVAVTGHSLGGGLADLVSAHYGCKGVSMNAISILDTIYTHMPELYAKSFAGADKWNFVDHANQYDWMAGSFEKYLSTMIKPVVAHRSDFSFDKVLSYHGLSSYVQKDSQGVVGLTDVVYTFTPNSIISNYMFWKHHSIDFGTSNADRIDKGLSALTSRTSYGGDGIDILLSSVWGDTLIGGNGNDTLDGNRGSDTYYYCKGDGVDTIHDIGGDDVLYLLGFDEEDSLSVSEEDGSAYINVVCNGETIVKISKKNREHVLFTTDSFNIVVDYEIDGHNPKVFDITDRFSTSIYGQRVLVACPVHVEILDPDGNVVHTLTDGEVGTWYTDYGNFYVFEEENGEYGKVLDLVEGYTARIVGADEGTMDVTYQTPVDGELTDPVSVSGVPVTEHLSATIEETEDGDVYLVIDEDGDGQTDSERKLYAECPFTDVTTSDYYYEPVRWAVDEGITSGTSATEFSPYESCLRSQVVTFLWRAAGKPAATSTHNPFVDVKPGDYYYDAVLWAVEKGITTGIDSTHFDPNGVCNRSQVVTFLYRAFEKPPVENAANPFTDVPAAEWYAAPVLWAVQEGITNGLSETKFGPNEVCNRSQVVTFLYRAYN